MRLAAATQWFSSVTIVAYPVQVGDNTSCSVTY